MLMCVECRGGVGYWYLSASAHGLISEEDVDALELELQVIASH